MHIGSGRSKYEVVLRESTVSKDVMGILAKISNGEIKGDQKFAREVLHDIETMKKVAYFAENRPEIDIELLKSRMYSEPIDFERNSTLRTMTVSRDVIEAQHSSDQKLAHAAKRFIQIAEGENVDPVLRYKLSKFLESKGIAVKDQIGAIDYAADGTGGFKKFGETRIRIDEFERTKRRDLGDQTIVSDDVVGRTKKLLDCY